MLPTLLRGLRWLLTGSAEVPPRPRSPLVERASALTRDADASTLVLVARARYLPHGGQDEITLRLTPQAGHVERRRTPRSTPPRHLERSLSAAECERLLATLHPRDLWQLTDECAPIRDGLVVDLALAQADRVHALHLVHSIGLSSGHAPSPLFELWLLLHDLLPLDER